MNAFFFSNITFFKKTTFGKAQDKARASSHLYNRVCLSVGLTFVKNEAY